MVVKLSDLAEAMPETKKKSKKPLKRKKNKDAEGKVEEQVQGGSENGTATTVPEVDGEQPTKKTKPLVDPEVVEQMKECEKVLSLEDVGFKEAISALTTLFHAVLEKNINVVLLREDFAGWMKTHLTRILKQVTSTSTPLFQFFSLALRVAPAAFEPVLEVVLNISIFKPREGLEVQNSCDAFMESLLTTFDKLRRLPKFIAKLLCCIRENIKPEDCKENGSLLSPRLMESLGPIISLMTVGQVVDLWKTLLHNLLEECIKPIVEERGDSRIVAFLSVVTDLVVEFLVNIKVADFTVPKTTVEKISEFMDKLGNECLKPLGELLCHQKKLDFSLMQSFFGLAQAYGHLHGMLMFYNSNYKSLKSLANPSSTVASDMVCLHPYLDSDSWNNTFERILKREDSVLTPLLVKLVEQKLMFMLILDKDEQQQTKDENGESVESSIKSQQLRNAADFIWNHQNKNNVQLSDETLILVSRHCEPKKVIELASQVIHNVQMTGSLSTGPSSLLTDFTTTSNPVFQYALILETMREIMQRVQKMKLLSKPIKAILDGTLSLENRTALILDSSATYQKPSTVGQKLFEELRDSVNSLLESGCNPPTTHVKTSEEFSGELITKMLQMLAEMSLECYPKDIKTTVFLCGTVVLFALLEQEGDNDVLNYVSKIVAVCGSDSSGNEIMFSVNWISFFRCFIYNTARFSTEIQTPMFNMILSNIYLSPKTVTEFETELDKLLKNKSADLDTPEGYLRLIVLEFLLTELQSAGTKAKLISQIREHSRKLAQFVSESFEESGPVASSNFFRACWLIFLAKDVMDEDAAATFNQNLCSYYKKCLKYIKSQTSKSSISDAKEIASSISYPIKFLHSICQSHSTLRNILSEDFLSKIWKVCYNPKVLQYEAKQIKLRSQNTIIPKNFVRGLLEASTASELKSICDAMMEKIEEFVENSSDFGEINMVIQVLAELADAELKPETKGIRHNTLQTCLRKLMTLSLTWDAKDAQCLTTVILPFVQFQTKILRRRKALVNPKTLSLCLLTTPSVPLNSLEDISAFRVAFCALSDLMNAFAVHRLDVVGFRSHVYLQGFQHLLESLMRRADQKNKLSDEEIHQLRVCAHSFERVCQSLKIGQAEFSRVAPYFISTLIRQFETFTVFPAVKIPILSGCYKLLDLCDEHGIAQLNSLLTVGSTEIFKAIYDQYTRFYKYKGRV